MKRITAIILAAAFMLCVFSSAIFPTAQTGYATGSVTVGATRLHTAPALNSSGYSIDAGVWGDPTIRIDSASRNAYLNDLAGGALSSLSMDLYFRWDDTYLYIAVVTDDPGVVIKSEPGAPWKGDAIQFIIDPDGLNQNPANPDNPTSSNAKNISFGLNSNDVQEVRDHTGSRTMSEAQTSYSVSGNTITFIAALPHSYFGLTSEDVRAGFT